MKKWLLGIVLVVCCAGLLAWWLHDDSEGEPLVCEQVTPGAKYAKSCTANELQRVRNAARWVVENVGPSLPIDAMAGVSSFIEDTGRRKRTMFYQRISVSDIDGACEAMLKHVHRRGEIDPERVKRREYERAMCLTKG